MKITSFLTALLFFQAETYFAKAGGSSNVTLDGIGDGSDLSWWEMMWENLECPDPVDFAIDEQLPLTCVENSIPPWPICLFHTIPYFIEASVSSASRCCDFDNLEECRCPMKDSPQWKVKMEDWCENIATCPDDIPVKLDLETEMWAKYMLMPGSETHDEGHTMEAKEEITAAHEGYYDSCDCDILDFECINDCYGCGCENVENLEDQLECVVECYFDADTTESEEEEEEEEESLDNCGCHLLDFGCINECYGCDCEDTNNPWACILGCYYDATSESESESESESGED